MFVGLVFTLLPTLTFRAIHRLLVSLVSVAVTPLGTEDRTKLPAPARLPYLTSGYMPPEFTTLLLMAMLHVPFRVTADAAVITGMVVLATLVKNNFVGPAASPRVRLFNKAVWLPPLLITPSVLLSFTAKSPLPACAVVMTNVPLLTVVRPDRKS